MLVTAHTRDGEGALLPLFPHSVLATRPRNRPSQLGGPAGAVTRGCDWAHVSVLEVGPRARLSVPTHPSTCAGWEGAGSSSQGRRPAPGPSPASSNPMAPKGPPAVPLPGEGHPHRRAESGSFLPVLLALPWGEPLPQL